MGLNIPKNRQLDALFGVQNFIYLSTSEQITALERQLISN